MDEEYLSYRQAAPDTGYRSVISVPLIAPGESLVGVLSVHRAVPGTKAADIGILSGITEFAACHHAASIKMATRTAITDR
jgi:GAF domain-containing protein